MGYTKIIYILICSCITLACTKEEPLELKKRIYKLQIVQKGEINGFHKYMYINSRDRSAHLYNQELEELSIPYELTNENLKQKMNTFYCVYTSKRKPDLFFNMQIFKFDEDSSQVRDSMSVWVTAFADSICILDTCHIFRSFNRSEVEENYDSIYNQSSLKIFISEYNFNIIKNDN